MFTAVFDASGREADQPCLVVAGFLAPDGAWNEFEKAWLSRLAEDGFNQFHAVDLEHYRKEFSKWSDLPDREDRKRSLLADLVGIIQSYFLSLTIARQVSLGFCFPKI